MLALLDALCDAQKVELLFADKEQARNFKAFVLAYISESGAGNGYGAYWCFREAEPVGVDTHRGEGGLDPELVIDMATKLCIARAGGGGDLTYYIPRFGHSGKAITFDFRPELLPSRIIPEAGDLVRIVDHPDFDRAIARLESIEGNVAKLAPCDYGIKEPVEILLGNLMKIDDFLPKRNTS